MRYLPSLLRVQILSNDGICLGANINKFDQMWYLLHICIDFAVVVNPFFRAVTGTSQNISNSFTKTQWIDPHELTTPIQVPCLAKFQCLVRKVHMFKLKWSTKRQQWPSCQLQFGQTLKQLVTKVMPDSLFFILLIRYPGLVTTLPSPPLDARGNLCSLASDALCAVWKSMFFHIYPLHCLLRWYYLPMLLPLLLDFGWLRT